MATLRVLLAKLDAALTEDQSRCESCGTTIHTKQGPHHPYYADQYGRSDCAWATTGVYGSSGKHLPGYVDTEDVADAAQAVVVAARSLPDTELDRPIEVER